MNAYIAYKCRKCGLIFIIPEDGIRQAEVMGNYFACPLCHGGIEEAGRYESLKECMEEANTYERKNGRVRQTRYK